MFVLLTCASLVIISLIPLELEQPCSPVAIPAGAAGLCLHA